jgi:hypothetical protein
MYLEFPEQAMIVLEEQLDTPYCNENDNDCNGGTNSGVYGTFIGNANILTLTAWKTCNDANSSAGSRIGAFAGITNWKVPSREELFSIVKYNTTATTTIDKNFFPDTVDDRYWTKIPSAYHLSAAWVISFQFADTYGINKNTSKYVRCVSSP